MRASLPALGFTVTLLGGLVALGAAFEPKNAAQADLLSIVSEPAGAQLLWDGKVIGKAPLTQPTMRGAHKLTFRLEGYAPADVSVEQPTQRVHQRLRPLTASLSIKAPGKAKLQLGPGIPRELEGRGPWKLAPGRYELTAVRDKIPAKPQRFELKPGQSLEVALDWPALPTLPMQLPPRLPQPTIAPPALNPSTYSPLPPQPRPRYNYYQPPAPRPVYRAPVEPLFTPIPPARYDPPPAPPPSYPGGGEPLFTPLP